MIVAGSVIVFLIGERTGFAAFVPADKSTFFVFLGHFILIRLLLLRRFLRFFLLFLFSVEVSSGSHLSNLSLLSAFLGVLDGTTLPEVGLYSLIAMLPDAASFDLLKLVPVVHDPATALPTFLDVVEYRLARVEFAGCPVVLALKIVFSAPWPLALLCLLHFTQFKYLL